MRDATGAAAPAGWAVLMVDLPLSFCIQIELAKIG
jgi:hypothetical protein